MEPAEILEEIQRRGATVQPLEGGRLGVSPRSALDDGLRAAIREHKLELLAALREPVEDEGLDGALLEARTDWGAVRLGTPYGEVWLARTTEVADGLVAEGTHLPVLLPEDVAALRGKGDEAIRAVLEVRRVFPGGTIQ